MLKLGNTWLPLVDGFKILVKPVSRVMISRAYAAMTAAKAAATEGGATDEDAVQAANDAYNRSMAKDAIVDWAGDIEDADGNPAMVTPANIDLLMDQAIPNSAFVTGYINPYLDQVAEKNASSLSSDGSSSTAASNTAPNAPNAPAAGTAPADATQTDKSNSAPS